MSGTGTRRLRAPQEFKRPAQFFEGVENRRTTKCMHAVGALWNENHSMFHKHAIKEEANLADEDLVVALGCDDGVLDDEDEDEENEADTAGGHEHATMKFAMEMMRDSQADLHMHAVLGGRKGTLDEMGNITHPGLRGNGLSVVTEVLPSPQTAAEVEESPRRSRFSPKNMLAKFSAGGASSPKNKKSKSAESSGCCFAFLHRPGRKSKTGKHTSPAAAPKGSRVVGVEMQEQLEDSLPRRPSSSHSHSH